MCGILQVFYALCIPVHREECISRKDKRITMVQLEIGLWNNSSVNRIQYPIHLCNFHLCNFWSPCLAKPGLTANSSQADKLLVHHVFKKACGT